VYHTERGGEREGVNILRSITQRGREREREREGVNIFRCITQRGGRESEREGVNIIPFSIAIAIASYSQLAS